MSARETYVSREAGLPADLLALADEIALSTGVTRDDVLIEAARDGLAAIKPRWERRKASPHV